MDILPFNVFGLVPASLFRLTLFELLLLSGGDCFDLEFLLLLLLPLPPLLLGYRNTMRGPLPNWSTTKAIPSTRNAAESVGGDIDDDDDDGDDDIAYFIYTWNIQWLLR